MTITANTAITAECVGDDPSMTLYGWQIFIAELISKHGLNARLSTNAGHNNVELVIETSGDKV